MSWTPPSPNRIKINVDGSFSSTTGARGIGGVFRDYSGTVLLHFAKQVKVNSAIYAEVLAIKEGILIAAAFRWSDVAPLDIESDSTNVISLFVSPTSTQWRFQNIIREATIQFVRQIEWSISYTRRSGNEVADILARVEVSGSFFIEFI